ncbi:MAG TPA: 2Fe-2S iron-sulfur cluster binding domain-containing protein [Polyangiaceae bacterium]|nr:2Fe-2S iron-sulfur cluster binding domain-containing protein [Polyangiaceae bacterium]
MFRRLFKKTDSTYKVSVPKLSVELDAPSDVTILEHALTKGVAFPHSCRVGTCGTCKAKLVSGKVYELSDKAYILSGDELRENYVLACQSMPRSDLVLELPSTPEALERTPVVEREGEITALRKLTHDILELEVKIEEPVTYRAGQYCEIYVPGVIVDEVRDSRSYSFAAAPGSAPVSVVRFHVRLVPGGAFTTWLHNEAKVGQRLAGHGPYGDFWLRPGKAPILAIAGGSGMAPLKALLEQACSDGVTRDVKYFFGARRQEDLYCLQEMGALEAAWKGKFEFVPVLSGEPEDSGWKGPRGFVSEHVLSVLGDRIADYQVYMCGPPPMLDSAEKIVLTAGVLPVNIHADKFYDRSHTQQRG